MVVTDNIDSSAAMTVCRSRERDPRAWASRSGKVNTAMSTAVDGECREAARAAVARGTRGAGYTHDTNADAGVLFIFLLLLLLLLL